MIFYKAQIELRDEFVGKNGDESRNYRYSNEFDDYNEDIYEAIERSGKNMCLQLTGRTGPKVLCAYMAYEGAVILSGGADVKGDIINMLRVGGFPYEIADISCDEISITEYNRADDKYDFKLPAHSRARRHYGSPYDFCGSSGFNFSDRFEQAVNKQAVRICAMEKRDVTKQMLFELEASDFDTNVALRYAKSKTAPIGFN